MVGGSPQTYETQENQGPFLIKQYMFEFMLKLSAVPFLLEK